jgi:hypothetical protein
MFPQHPGRISELYGKCFIQLKRRPMKEKDIREKGLNHALMWRNWRPLHWQDGRAYPCQHCHKTNILTPQHPGRSDTLAIRGDASAFIEVKDCKEKAFAFSEISSDQRKYLDDAAKDDIPTYICIGKIVPMGSKERIHSIYVIPWKKWVLMETEMILILESGSIPYDYSLYEKKPAVRCSDLVTRFKEYALEYRDGDWHFPDIHPLAVQPEVEVPWHMRKKIKEAA